MNILDLLETGENILGLAGSGNAPNRSAQFMIPRGTLVFLQLAYAQAFSIIGRALIGPTYNFGTVYILFGCAKSGSGPYSFSEGAVFYKDEIFYFPPLGPSTNNAVALTGSNVAFFAVEPLDYNNASMDADPVIYTGGGGAHNIHQIRQMKIVAGAYDQNNPLMYTNASSPNFTVPPELNLTGTGEAAVSGTYPNFNINVPSFVNNVITSGSAPVNNVPGGDGFSISISFPTNLNLSDNNYYVIGSLRGGTDISNASVIWDLVDELKTKTGFTVWVREWTGGTQDLSFDYIVFSQ